VIHNMLVATDRSDTAARPVQWAAEMSDKYAAQLIVLQVVTPEHLTGHEGEDATRAVSEELAAFTRQVCGERGRPLLVYDPDPTEAIVRVCDQERVDLVVVGSNGTRDRTGSVPDRVSRNAQCSVVIVNTAPANAPEANAPEANAPEANAPETLAVVVLERRIRKALRARRETRTPLAGSKT
jgi:ubiquinone biosynthesis protein